MDISHELEAAEQNLTGASIRQSESRRSEEVYIYIYLYIYIYICVCVCVCIYTYIYIYIYIYIWIKIDMYAKRGGCIESSRQWKHDSTALAYDTLNYAELKRSVCMYVYIYIYTHVYMYIYIYIYVCMYV